MNRHFRIPYLHGHMKIHGHMIKRCILSQKDRFQILGCLPDPCLFFLPVIRHCCHCYIYRRLIFSYLHLQMLCYTVCAFSRSGQLRKRLLLPQTADQQQNADRHAHTSRHHNFGLIFQTAPSSFPSSKQPRRFPGRRS